MNNNKSFVIEVCGNSFESALAAQNGGAKRVELCDNLAEGGTTPSYAHIALSKQRLTIEIWPIIRPRGGDFLYSDIEFELMKEDIKNCKALQCDGVVLGILTKDGSIDIPRCQELIQLASPLPVAFHRAFDMSNNLEKALEEIIQLGCVRILTSGGATSAPKGAKMLRKLIQQAAGRICIMPGAGVNEENIGDLALQTGATEFHTSAKVFVASKMEYRNAETKMGSIEDEYRYELSSADRVANMISRLKEMKN